MEDTAPDPAFCCRIEGCSVPVTIRHGDAVWCAAHGLAELIRRGVLRPLSGELESAIESIEGLFGTPDDAGRRIAGDW